MIAGPNGGYLAGLLTHAGDEHLADPRRQLRSFTVHYLRPPRAGSAEIEVMTEQLGRSVAYLRLKMTQNEKRILIATGAWAMPQERIDKLITRLQPIQSELTCHAVAQFQDENARDWKNR